MGWSDQTHPRPSLERSRQIPRLNHNSRPYWFTRPEGGTGGGSQKNQWEELKLPEPPTPESFFPGSLQLVTRKEEEKKKKESQLTF